MLVGMPLKRYRLYLAAKEGDLDAVSMHLAAGVSTEWRHPLTAATPLVAAAENDEVEAANMLIEAGANVHARDRQGSTALTHAAANGYTELARRLLSKGADPSAQSMTASIMLGRLQFGRSKAYAPIHETAQHGYVELAALLTDAGADLEAADNDGDTALHVASYYGQSELANVLIKAGANINAKNGSGETPLITALERTRDSENVFTSGHAAITKLLLEAGCTLDDRDDSGNTALSIAELEKRTELVALLQRAPLDRALRQVQEADLLIIDVRVLRRGVAAAREYELDLPEAQREELVSFASRAEAAQENPWEALRQLQEQPPLALDCISFAACARTCNIELEQFDVAESEQITAKALAIKARHNLAPGQKIRIRRAPLEEAKRLAIGHGGWNSKMSGQLGLEGTVLEVDDDGDVRVHVGQEHSERSTSGMAQRRLRRLAGSGRKYKARVASESKDFCWNPTMIEALEDQLQAPDPDPVKRQSGIARAQAARVLGAARAAKRSNGSLDRPSHGEESEKNTFRLKNFDDEYATFVAHCASTFSRARRLQEAAMHGTSCVFYFLDADRIRDPSSLALFEPLQQLRVTHPDWVKEMEISVEDACSGRFAEDHMACSHRWDERDHPDRGGVQLMAMRRFLTESPRGRSIKWVWYE